MLSNTDSVVTDSFAEYAQSRGWRTSWVYRTHTIAMLYYYLLLNVAQENLKR
ncbi:hypothetical protein [Anabaena sp. 4-3]|uniref:hypothetical protein n=1 Tax=Anabaena sp. 4-3 TaxID=1811979 RepID=UPI0012E8C438|nr:hypothetical protein [Anabaena sp. 4-3]